ncbi:hypothetical protein BDW72DRAFT_144530 [Aspergillus terricola var. indicus]
MLDTRVLVAARAPEEFSRAAADRRAIEPLTNTGKCRFPSGTPIAKAGVWSVGVGWAGGRNRAAQCEWPVAPSRLHRPSYLIDYLIIESDHRTLFSGVGRLGNMFPVLSPAGQPSTLADEPIRVHRRAQGGYPKLCKYFMAGYGKSTHRHVCKSRDPL